MDFQFLTLERRDGVATITLNRPDAFNALSLGLGRELGLWCRDESLVSPVRTEAGVSQRHPRQGKPVVRRGRKAMGS